MLYAWTSFYGDLPPEGTNLPISVCCYLKAAAYVSEPNSDADDDGIDDYDELFVHGTDPSNSDTDGDGLLDWQEVGLRHVTIDDRRLPIPSLNWSNFETCTNLTRYFNAPPYQDVHDDEDDDGDSEERVVSVDWKLPPGVRIQGVTVSYVTVYLDGTVVFHRAGSDVDDVFRIVPFRHGEGCETEEGALEYYMKTEGDAESNIGPTCIRAGTVQHGDGIYLLFRFDNIWNVRVELPISIGLMVPVDSGDRAYVHLHSQSNDWIRFMVRTGVWGMTGFSGFTGRYCPSLAREERAMEMHWNNGEILYGMYFGYGTNPCNPDTDGDGLLDSEEIKFGCDPRNADTDDDGVSDYDELHANPQTDPTNFDTDGDGMPNGWERRNGLNPNDPSDAAQDAENVWQDDSPLAVTGLLKKLLRFDFDGAVRQSLRNAARDAALAAVRTLLGSVVRTLVFVLCFLVLTLLLRLVTGGIDKVLDLPVLNALNTIGGGALGFAKKQWAICDATLMKELCKIVYITRPTVFDNGDTDPLKENFTGYVDFGLGWGDARQIIFSNPA